MNYKIELFANLQGADLQGADMRGADLRGADLRGADLQGAILQGATIKDGFMLKTGAPLSLVRRSDGYEFRAWNTDHGWRIIAGCRFFSLSEATRHWRATRGGTPLGDETMAILTYFRAMIRLSGKES